MYTQDDITKADIAKAVRDNDAQSKNSMLGLESIMRTLGVDFAEVMSVAHQRALRQYVIVSGGKMPGPGQMFDIPDEAMGVVQQFVLSWLDGFAAGLRASRNQSTEQDPKS